MITLRQGDKAPDFTAKDQDGNTVSLKDFNGKKLVLYFYPKDDTPGCTKEACNFRDNQSELKKKGFAVVGVSPDNERSHQKFIKKFSLNFPLLADTDKSIINAYGVWGLKKFMGREYEGVLRTTFVIDEKGVIEKVIDKVDTEESTKQILEELAA
jgi:peroxiredoxin Q/BCP